MGCLQQPFETHYLGVSLTGWLEPEFLVAGIFWFLLCMVSRPCATLIRVSFLAWGNTWHIVQLLHTCGACVAESAAVGNLVAVWAPLGVPRLEAAPLRPGCLLPGRWCAKGPRLFPL